ncbi:MAG: hypothetical protein KBS81_06095 [Spirochaetales bacterium]|nr:hypothetical protein [Candidatus Physcosoma equi]
MYKKQMAFQKIVCFVALVCGVLAFIYSLGIMTDLYDCLYPTIADQSDLNATYVTGSRVYYDMQGFNRTLLSGSIVLLLSAVLLFIFQTNNRRRYYVANYVTTGLFCAIDLALVVWSHFQIQVYRAMWLNINFEELAQFSKMFKTAYTESTFWFDIHYLVFGICLVEACLLIGNMVWKIKCMKAEAALIEEGKKA